VEAEPAIERRSIVALALQQLSFAVAGARSDRLEVYGVAGGVKPLVSVGCEVGTQKFTATVDAFVEQVRRAATDR